MNDKTFSDEFSLAKLWTNNVKASRIINYFVINVENLLFSSVEIIFLPFSAAWWLLKSSISSSKSNLSDFLATPPVITGMPGDIEVKKMVGTKYTPIAKREDRPNAIAWLTKNYPQLADSQICKLVGTTKNTVAAIRTRKHWNMSNISPKDPVAANLCTQTDLMKAVERAKRKLERIEKEKKKEKAKLADPAE